MAFVANNFPRRTHLTKLVFEQIRFYPRWSHRRPKRVLTPEEYEEITVSENASRTPLNEDDSNKKTPELVNYSIKPKKVVKPLIATYQRSKVKAGTDMLETVMDSEGNFVYTKMKNNDSRVATILTQIKSKKDKTAKDLILLEGRRLIKSALQSGCQLKYVLFSRKADLEDLKPFLPKIGAKLYKMPYSEIQMWSDLSTTPGVMGLFKIPDSEAFTPKESLPFTVICDNVREPGNLGTILRISAAAGCRRVILTKGCVNLWDTKVLRSSMGAHFKLCIKSNLDWEEIAENVNLRGNIFIADNKIISGEDFSEILEKIPVFPYYDIDYTISKELVLVVGGETMGISRDSYELALKMNGARINIPLSNEIDSLNVGAALSVIAFEMKKQLTCK